MKLIKFEKEGCSPCMFVQTYLDGKKVEVQKVDAFAEPKMSAKYKIGTVPTVILTDNDGEELERSVGYNPPELDSMIAKMQGEGQ